MKRMALVAAALIFGATASTTFPEHAVAQPIPPGECPAKLEPGREALVCHCSGDAVATGSVWGSDIYTDNSELCRAALHAGAVREEGGTIRVDARPGRVACRASTRRGVASGDWGSWQRSFLVTRATAANSVSPGYPENGPAICPASAGVLATPGTTLTCRCPAEAATSGSVWGSGPYTTNSAICPAARHAGVIGSRGGTVTLRAAPGRSSYAGSEANGVSTGDWGSYPTSFEFDG